MNLKALISPWWRVLLVPIAMVIACVLITFVLMFAGVVMVVIAPFMAIKGTQELVRIVEEKLDD